MADSTLTPWNDQQRLRLLLSWLTQQLADKAGRYVATSPAGDGDDLYALLSASYELYEQAQQLLRTAVTLNRAGGVSWQAIADVTGGGTASAAHQRYSKHTQGVRDRADLVGARPPQPQNRQDRPATGASEIHAQDRSGRRNPVPGATGGRRDRTQRHQPHLA